jgi:hypothetical protein
MGKVAATTWGVETVLGVASMDGVMKIARCARKRYTATFPLSSFANLAKFKTNRPVRH